MGGMEKEERYTKKRKTHQRKGIWEMPKMQ